TGMALPSVSRPRWAGLLLLCSLAVALLAFAGLGRLEVTSKAIGGLRVADGPRPITAQVSGVVSSLSVRAGERVEAEHALAKIEARELSARVERSVRQVELLRDEASEAKQTTASLQDKTIVALEQKRGLLWQRAKLKQQQVTARQGHAERVAELVRQGAAPGVEAMAAQEQVAVAKEELLALREEAATIGVQIADREHSYGADRVERDFRVREAEVGLAEARALAVLGIVSAPESGRVESLLVSEGQVIQAGTGLARIVPDGQASGVVVVAPAKDAAVRPPGLEASLEVPSLPVGEYGKAKARVTRVAEELALPEEVSEVLGPDAGDEGGVVRVELTL